MLFKLFIGYSAISVARQSAEGGSVISVIWEWCQGLSYVFFLCNFNFTHCKQTDSWVRTGVMNRCFLVSILNHRIIWFYINDMQYLLCNIISVSHVYLCMHLQPYHTSKQHIIWLLSMMLLYFFNRNVSTCNQLRFSISPCQFLLLLYMRSKRCLYYSHGLFLQ